MSLTAAVAPLDALERLAAPLPRRVGAGLLRTMVGTQTSLARGYYAAAPADLLGVVRRHVNRLEALKVLPMDTGARYSLDTLRADAAAMAGWLAFDADRRGEARAYFILSQEAARHAGDGALHGLAVASIGLLSSNTHGGEHGAASYHLRQAALQLPDHTPTPRGLGCWRRARRNTPRPATTTATSARWSRWTRHWLGVDKKPHPRASGQVRASSR